MKGLTTMTQIEREIRRFLSETFLFGMNHSVPANQSLIELGVLDSTGVLELASFFEDCFGIEVVDDDFVPDNFESISQMVAFLQSKMAGAGRTDRRHVA